jgi:hypothetical protein
MTRRNASQLTKEERTHIMDSAKVKTIAHEHLVESMAKVFDVHADTIRLVLSEEGG